MRVNRIEELAQATQNYSLLAELPREHVRKLLEIAEERNYEQDEIIFLEGAKSEFLFLIASGNVALEIPGGRKILLQTLGPGDAHGLVCLDGNGDDPLSGARAFARSEHCLRWSKARGGL